MAATGSIIHAPRITAPSGSGTVRVSIALRAAKESIDAGLETDLETGLAIERNWFAGLFATEDRERGMRSFVEEGPGKAKFV